MFPLVGPRNQILPCGAGVGIKTLR